LIRKKIKPKWSLKDYANLIDALTSYASIISLEEYADCSPGLWLRHDVELDDEAAIAMAKLENSKGISATYFICYESPYLFIDQAIGLAQEIKSLGHDIGIHRLWGKKYCNGFRSVVQLTEKEYFRVTFHAPGVDICNQALEEFGSPVYINICNGIGEYFSDSTGNWRWGHPLNDCRNRVPLQLLTHPFWWSNDMKGKQIALSEGCMFFPQIINGAI
jgi:hypothetical protein